MGLFTKRSRVVGSSRTAFERAINVATCFTAIYDRWKQGWNDVRNIRQKNWMGNCLTLLRDDILTVIDNNWAWEAIKVKDSIFDESIYHKLENGYFTLDGEKYYTCSVQGRIFIFDERSCLDKIELTRMVDGLYHIAKYESSFKSRCKDLGKTLLGEIVKSFQQTEDELEIMVVI